MDDSGSISNDLVEKIFKNYRYPLILLLLGLIVIGFAVLSYKGVNIFGSNNSKVEVIVNSPIPTDLETKVVIEIAGAVKIPGVYEFQAGARVDEAINRAGGLDETSDEIWVSKNVNRAARLVDGQKIYIFTESEISSGKQTDVASAKDERGELTISNTTLENSTGIININSASQKELESLWGIGPVYAQNIIEHRPYSVLDELVTKKIIRKATFEKIINQITI